MKVKLSTIVEGLEMVSEMNRVYYDPDTGEVGFVFEEFSGGYEEEEEESIPENALLLPTSFEINEYSIMENFVYSLDDADMRQELLWAINGRGAFRKFKHFIHRHNIQDEWYDFKHKSYTEMAKAWCNWQNLTYD